MPSGTLWDFDRNRLVVGVESMQLQGIQYEYHDIITNGQHQDLAGNMFLIFSHVKHFIFLNVDLLGCLCVCLLWLDWYVLLRTAPHSLIDCVN